MNLSTKKFLKIIIVIFVSLQIAIYSFGQPAKTKMEFIVAMEHPADHHFQVRFQCEGIKKDWLDFKIPVWMPGYYQLLDYADNIIGFEPTDKSGTAFKWEKAANNIWRVYTNNR